MNFYSRYGYEEHEILYPVYTYENTYIKVHPGSTGKDFATYRMSPSNKWVAMRKKEMPRLTDRYEAIKNLKIWAEENELTRVDCDVCEYRTSKKCHKFDSELLNLSNHSRIVNYLRCKKCLQSEHNPYNVSGELFCTETRARIANSARNSIFMKNDQIERFIAKILRAACERDVHIRVSATSDTYWSFLIEGEEPTVDEIKILQEITKYFPKPDEDMIYLNKNHLQGVLALKLISLALPFNANKAYAVDGGLIFLEG